MRSTYEKDYLKDKEIGNTCKLRITKSSSILDNIEKPSLADFRSSQMEEQIQSKVNNIRSKSVQVSILSKTKIKKKYLIKKIINEEFSRLKSDLIEEKPTSRFVIKCTRKNKDSQMEISTIDDIDNIETVEFIKMELENIIFPLRNST